ncbi:MAG: hypothetical protein MI919_20850, partial [Holophagales bacterium]|nr:hypothetical protein [Holophagales bacterium]
MLAPTLRLPPLERLPTTTILGIRFWDLITDTQVRDGLRVEAWPVPGLRPVRRAARTVADLWAFHGLPGLVGVEHAPKPDRRPAPGSPPPSGSPPAPSRRPFVVRVLDQRRRFVPVAFRVELPLPYDGAFLGESVTSPVGETPRGFLLFSGHGRGPVAGHLAVRGELRDVASGEPAGHALIRVDPPGPGPARFGLADGSGRFAVHVPSPWPADSILGGSPPGGSPPSSPAGSPAAPGAEIPLDERAFPFTLRVFRRPGGPGADPAARLDGTDLPDLARLLAQPPAPVYALSPDQGG